MTMTASSDSPRTWKAHLPRARRYVEHLVALVLSTAFALGLSPDYGVDNQVIYMLGSLKILDPELFTRDWVVMHTTHYHRAFEYLAAACIGVDRSGKGVLVVSVLAVVAGMMALYALIRTLAPKVVLPSFAAMMLLALATRTKGPAATYVFDHILQPSTLGSVGLLGAALFFARGRYFVSGLAVAFAGIFHGNYLILLFGACIAAHASLGGRDLPRRLALQLAAPSFVLLLLLPVILRTAHSPDSARAQEIYTTIRAPHHFLLSRSVGDFAPLLAWQMLGLGGAALLRKGHEDEIKRTLAFTGGLGLMVWGGVMASALFHSSAATQLFPWRIAPHVALLCQTLAAAGLMRAAVRPTELSEVPSGAVFMIGSGVGLLCLHHGVRNEPNIAFASLAFTGAAVLTTVVVYLARLADPRLPASVLTAGATALGAFAYGAASLGPSIAILKTVEPTIKSLPEKSTLFKGISKDERELCDFMRTKTPKDALFLSPPGVETIRFQSQRAIIADWKSNPVVPSEVLEWYRRMGELSGRPRFGGWSDLGGYDAMDAKRLSSLVEEYHPDFAIVGLGKSAQLGCFATAYENARYTVVDLKRPCVAPASALQLPLVPQGRSNDEGE